MTGRHMKKIPPAAPPQPKSRRRLVWRIVGPAAVLMLGVGAFYAHHVLTSTPISRHPIVPVGVTPDPNRVNILLIGTDTRPGETGGNTDVLIFCSIDTPNKRIELMSIPRDTKILYPDGQYRKINEALALEGPRLTEQLVGQLLHQSIDYYALTHFGGLINVIDTLGGITVDVPEPMHYNTGDKQYNIIDLNPGVQHLSGVQALGFVRFRHDALGDIGRTERQQIFLKALEAKLMRPENITKLPVLVSELSKTVDTDLSLTDMASLGANATRYEKYQVISETLPGSFQDPHDVPYFGYWIVNPQQAQYEARQFFYQGDVVKNPIQDPSYTANWTPPAPKPAGSGTANTSNTTTAATTNTTTATTGGTLSNTSVSSNTTSSQTPMVISASSAFIRSGPGTNYGVVGSAVHGQTVYVIGKSGGWDQVDIGNGATGYIASWLLSQG